MNRMPNLTELVYINIAIRIFFRICKAEMGEPSFLKSVSIERQSKFLAGGVLWDLLFEQLEQLQIDE